MACLATIKTVCWVVADSRGPLSKVLAGEMMQISYLGP